MSVSLHVSISATVPFLGWKTKNFLESPYCQICDSVILCILCPENASIHSKYKIFLYQVENLSLDSKDIIIVLYELVFSDFVFHPPPRAFCSQTYFAIIKDLFIICMNNVF